MPCWKTGSSADFRSYSLFSWVNYFPSRGYVLTVLNTPDEHLSPGWALHTRVLLPVSSSVQRWWFSRTPVMPFCPSPVSPACCVHIPFPNSHDCIKCPWDQWPNLQKVKCLAKEIEILSYEEPLGVFWLPTVFSPPAFHLVSLDTPSLTNAFYSRLFSECSLPSVSLVSWLECHIYCCLWHLFLSYLIPVSYCSDMGCRLRASQLSATTGHGDILIGTLLPFHIDKLFKKFMFREAPSEDICSMFFLEMFQHFQAMRFALEEINGNPDLLPNVTLGLIAFDSCAALRKELEGTMWMLSGQVPPIPNYSCRDKPHLAAVLGHTMSSSSVLMAHIMGLYRFPQISHFSTSSLLSDRTQFPSFFRTVPSDTFQSQGLAQLILHFAWTWVGMIALGNDYGQQGVQVVKEELLKAGACVAFTEFIIVNSDDRNIPRITRVIKGSTAKVILVFANELYFALLVDEMLRQHVPGKIFVASEAWSTSTILGVEKYSSLLVGSIGFAFYSSAIPGFKEFVTHIRPLPVKGPGDNLNQIFWEKTFGCRFLDQMSLSQPRNNSTKLCTGFEDLSTVDNVYTDMSNLRGSLSIYTSVQIVAKALHDMSTCPESRDPFYNRNFTDIWNFKPWQLKQYIQNIHVKLKNGREVFFDKNGDLPAVYDIVNWQPGSEGVIKKVKVGSYDTSVTDGDIFTINISAITWPTGKGQIPTSICSESCSPGFRRVVRQGEPVCCFECILCPNGEFSNRTDSDDCYKCPRNLWPNAERSKCIPKTIEYLSYDGPLGCSLTATGVSSSLMTVFILCLFFHYRHTPIIKANNYSLSCILLMSIALCFLCSLNFIGYPQTLTCLMRQAVFGMVFAVCISTVLAKTLMVVFAFMATKPNSRLRRWTSPKVSYMIISTCSVMQLLLCVVWLTLAPPYSEYNTQAQPEIIIAECNEGSSSAFWSMLGYLGLLSSVSFIVAFLARTLPDSFNEAKFITFSMLAFLSVWVSYIPAALSARGQYVVAMEVFAILSSSWALVICMFLPKCFIILFKPSMNSKEYLMGKDKPGAKQQLQSHILPNVSK
ncbi:PREDICTED: extracellular calcium-sensing receptor-like [Nanorana parkeri]|uniref:extracellular calcium-sensing receptor-like n=1 Tax=Nanorana parkeri TaxID=125878 RepID=UPI0008541826|nr:PREDICTED: extracellular calcium-sensing receptor-like [Nanorana parkeri]